MDGDAAADGTTSTSEHPTTVQLVSGGPAKWLLRLESGRVTLTKVKFFRSTLMGSLGDGRSAVVSNWRRNDGHDLVIRVTEINAGFSPGYARVEITFGPQAQGAAPDPTPLPTSKPTMDPCGNKVCDADETPASCPSDCVVKSLKTLTEVDASSRGQILTVSATTGVTIFSLDVISRRAGDSNVQVYTRPNGYLGYEESNSSWELILDKTITMRRGYRSNLGAFDREVDVAPGSTQSFYVWNGQGMMYTRGNGSGAGFASDGALVISEGVAVRNLFGEVVGNAEYSGWIRYYASSSD